MVHNLEDYNSDQDRIEEYLDYIGDEWSDKTSFLTVMEEFVYPYVKEGSIIGEIGSGGGRVSSRLATKAGKLVCFDISTKMLEVAKSRIRLEFPELDSTFVPLDNAEFPDEFLNESGYFDFVCVFDVFPHVDLHTQWQYYQEIFKSLKNNGYALIHTANLETEKGWNRFQQQKEFSSKGFYFMVSSMTRLLLDKAGFKIIDESSPNRKVGNMYYERDYIAIVQKRNI